MKAICKPIKFWNDESVILYAFQTETGQRHISLMAYNGTFFTDWNASDLYTLLDWEPKTGYADPDSKFKNWVSILIKKAMTQPDMIEFLDNKFPFFVV